MKQIKVWRTAEGFSSNAPIIAGKEWGMEPYRAAYLLALASKEELRSFGIEEISFTLTGQTEPIWRLRIALQPEGAQSL